MAEKIIFINSHPIQYFAPLYKKMTEEGLDVEVWYGSDESIKGEKDRQFGVKVKWDIPLVEGYRHRFFKNYSWTPSIYNGFFGLLNLGILKALWKSPKSLVIIHGWGYAISVLAIIWAKLIGHQVALRGESPLNQELLKSPQSRILKRIFLQYFLFCFIDRFLYIGKQNKAYYQFYGVKNQNLVFTPYAVDNERFQKAACELLPRKIELRKELDLPVDAKIILFSGKYIHKKRPMDLLQAYAALELSDKALVMVGEGELRPQMEQFIAANQLKDVFLTGFVNQSEIVKYYAIADVFVMSSGDGETWGLSTNEAMNFGLPLVISDLVGCAEDLVDEFTGYTFSFGSVKELTDTLLKVIKLMHPSLMIVEKINKYSFERINNSLRKL